MLTPRTPIEQLNHEPFVQTETLVVLFGNSQYNKVCTRDSEGGLVPVYSDLQSVHETC